MTTKGARVSVISGGYNGINKPTLWPGVYKYEIVFVTSMVISIIYKHLLIIRKVNNNIKVIFGNGCLTEIFDTVFIDTACVFSRIINRGKL